MTDTSRISPTAHYTGHVWYEAGLSHPALMTRRGQTYYRAVRPFDRAYEVLRGGPTLEGFLLQRHAILDHLLTRAIEDGRVGQVIEIAAGLSPRGFAFTKRYPHLRYIEADLPDMATLKRQILSEHGLFGQDHQVVTLNALLESGPTSLREVAAAHLDAEVGAAIITEGLISYFPLTDVEPMWARFAQTLAGYPAGLYLSDLHLIRDYEQYRMARVFRRFLAAFAKGSVNVHHRDRAHAEEGLRAAGFQRATLHSPSRIGPSVEMPRFERPDVIHVLEASATG